MIVCPTCGQGSLVQRKGSYGDFLGCTKFPACRHTQQIAQSVQERVTSSGVNGDQNLS